MTLWMGKPGALLVELPRPVRGATPTLARRSTVADTIGGGRIVGFTPGPGRRTYEMSWPPWLTPEVGSILEEFQTGARGSGPYALLDAGRRNHLSANQASAGSVDNDGTGCSPAAGETVDAVPAPVLRGPRALRWSLPASGTTAGILRLDGPARLPGWPLPPVEPWCWSVHVSAGGADQAVTVTAVLAWLDSAGYEVATTTGATAVTAAGAWVQVSAAGAPPVAAAVYVRPELHATPGSYGSTSTGRGDWPIHPLRQVYGRVDPAAIAGSAPLLDFWFGGDVEVYLDRLQLEMATTPTAWVLGTGVPLVSVQALDTTYQLLPGRAHSATFVEVG